MAVYISKIRQKANTLWKSVIIFEILRIWDCGYGNWELDLKKDPPSVLRTSPPRVEPEEE